MTQRDEFESLVKFTLAILDASEAKDAKNGVEENANICLDVYRKCFREFSREWREMTDLPCPVGCKQCWDGSCVPENQNCP